MIIDFKGRNGLMRILSVIGHDGETSRSIDLEEATAKKSRSNKRGLDQYTLSALICQRE